MEVVILAIFFQLSTSSSRFVPELSHQVPSSCATCKKYRGGDFNFSQKTRQLEATTLRLQYQRSGMGLLHR